MEIFVIFIRLLRYFKCLFLHHISTTWPSKCQVRRLQNGATLHDLGDLGFHYGIVVTLTFHLYLVVMLQLSEICVSNYIDICLCLRPHFKLMGKFLPAAKILFDHYRVSYLLLQPIIAFHISYYNLLSRFISLITTYYRVSYISYYNLFVAKDKTLDHSDGHWIIPRPLTLI